jgi:hypothetical protein
MSPERPLASGFRCGAGPYTWETWTQSRVLLAAVAAEVGFFYALRPPAGTGALDVEVGEQEITGIAPPASPRVPFLSYPRGGIGARTWKAGGARMAQLDNGVELRVDKGLATAAVGGSTPAEEIVATYVRLIRSFCDRALQDAGWARLHAAAVRSPGGATLFVGASGSGKTALMLHEAIRGARIVAFDKVFVKFEDDELHCLGVPTTLGLHRYAARAYGIFAGRFRADEAEDGATVPRGSVRHKARIPAAIVGAVFPGAGGGPFRVDAVVFPSWQDTRPRALSPSAAVEKLRPHVLGRQLSPWELDWLGLNVASSTTAANTEALLSGLTALALPFSAAPASAGLAHAYEAAR